jgi:hypothetical protein
MKTAEQARREIVEKRKSREDRWNALVEKGKNIGSGNAVFLILSIIYSAIDMEIELERSSLHISRLMDVQKINPETLKVVIDALRKSGYVVIHNDRASCEFQFYVSW